MSLRLRVDDYQLEGLDSQLLTLAYSCVMLQYKPHLNERNLAQAIYRIIKPQLLETLIPNFESPLALSTLCKKMISLQHIKASSC